MNTKSWLGAGAAALVGALIWGGIAALTNYEIGLIAWGIGALVGFGAHAFGSQGKEAGIACAALAVVSILGGKVLTVTFSAPGQMREILEAGFTQETLDELVADAEAYPPAPSAEERDRFIVEHGYSDAETPEDLTNEERADFETRILPMLEDLKWNKPTFEVWREKQV
jgi:hypothetical protein